MTERERLLLDLLFLARIDVASPVHARVTALLVADGLLAPWPPTWADRKRVELRQRLLEAREQQRAGVMPPPAL